VPSGVIVVPVSFPAESWMEAAKRCRDTGSRPIDFVPPPIP